MYYVSPNYRSKAELKRALAAGKVVGVYATEPHEAEPREGMEVSVGGPHYPEPHKWYARVVVGPDGVVAKVKA